MRRLHISGALIIMLTFAAAPASATTHSRTASDYFLSTGPSFSSGGDSTTRDVNLTFTLTTGSSREVLFRDVGRSGPGMKLIAPTWWRNTQIIPSHETIVETIEYHVSDCSKVPKGNWPLPLEVSWKGGKWYVISLQMPPEGMGQQWQQWLTDSVCQKQSPSIHL